MKHIVLIVMTLASVVCMGALTKPTQKMLNVPHWRVDANITGANANLGSADVASYTGITNSGLTLTNNAGNGVLTAQIPCSSTNSPSGTTCAAGDESVGVSFTIPSCPNSACDVLACASFSHFVATGAGGALPVVFQIVETPNAAQTISQEGKSRIQVGVSTANTSVSAGVRVCGTFTFTTAGQKTLRLFFEQDVTGTIANNILLMDVSAAEGQRDLHWEVTPYPTGY